MLLLSPAGLEAADSPAGWRSAALMPWQVMGLDAEFTVRHREQMKQLYAAIQQAWIQNGQPLDQAAQQQGITLSFNEQHLAHKIMVGSSQAKIQEPHHLQPVICSIGDSLLMAIELISTRNSQILAAEQILVPRAPWEQWRVRKPSAPPVPNGPWQEAIQNLLKDASDPVKARKETFKLKLGLSRGSHDSRTGSHLCLNMLVAHSLAPQFILLPMIGELETIYLRRVWKIQEPVLRSTRELVLDWGSAAPKGTQFKAEGRWSEAVLGSSINRNLAVKTAIDISQEKLQVPSELIEVLQREAASIAPQDKPQVAKIHGAWAYLDRGRAWGLEMDDRLYLDDGQRLIKGHVVGFYGAGLGLKSPRGFPIHEGAILFIRTGQRKVRVGDSLGFDPTHFPTPWPPVRQPSQASLSVP